MAAVVAGRYISLSSPLKQAAARIRTYPLARQSSSMLAAEPYIETAMVNRMPSRSAAWPPSGPASSLPAAYAPTAAPASVGE